MKKVLEENAKARELNDAIMKKVLEEKDKEFFEMKNMMEHFLKKWNANNDDSEEKETYHAEELLEKVISEIDL